MKKELSLSSPHKSAPKNNAIIYRNESILAANHQRDKSSHTLQLPRFYSNDNKVLNQKNIVFKSQNVPRDYHKIAKITDKMISKRNLMHPQYIKTQKIQTPIKDKQLSLKKIQQTSEKSKKNSIERGSVKQIKEINPNRQNKFRIDKYDRKEEHFTQLNHKNPYSKQSKKHIGLRNYRQTQNSIKFKANKTPSQKISTSPLLKQYLQDTNITNDKKHDDQNNNRESRESKESTLNEQQRQKLMKVYQLFKNMCNCPGNLDWPQLYITMDKQKVEKKIFNSLQDRDKKPYKNYLMLSRLTVYMCAHLILLSIDARMLLGVISKLLQIQQIICGIFGLKGIKKRRSNSNSFKTRSNYNQIQYWKQDAFLKIQNRMNGITRNNDLIEKLLSALFSKKSIPHNALFKNMLESSMKIQSFEYIHVIDKTMKWEILKMPSYPFLPQAFLHHGYYLILDLDETLIHFNSESDTFHVRPFAQEFLKRAAPYFQITIFTAATKEYADEILNEIDPGNTISHRLYRNHLTFLNGDSIKDISLLGRNLKKTIIVDNLQTNFRLHPENGILIRSWYGSDEDDILAKLYGLLIKIINYNKEDIRVGLKDYAQFIKEEITAKDYSYQIKYDI